MKKQLSVLSLFFTVMVSGAYAQTAATEPATPSRVSPPLPVAFPTATAPAASNFPALPPARPCKPRDVKKKTWKLMKIYQEPVGTEQTEFDASPWSYTQFTEDNTYKIIKPAKRLPRAVFWREFERKEGDPLQQYLVHEKGFIYFYNSGNVVDTQACFIVTSDRGDFKKNDMLLMPPAPSDNKPPAMRMVKDYREVKNGPNQKRRKKNRR